MQQVGTESLQYEKSSEHLSGVFSGLKPDFNEGFVSFSCFDFPFPAQEGCVAVQGSSSHKSFI